MELLTQYGEQFNKPVYVHVQVTDNGVQAHPISDPFEALRQKAEKKLPFFPAQELTKDERKAAHRAWLAIK